MPELEPVEHNPFGAMLEPVEHNPFQVTLEPVDHDPWAAAGIQGNAAQAAQQLQATEAQRREAMNTLVRSGPGRIAAPNPYPPGSEEWEFYEQSRGQGISQAGAQTALNMIGGGTSFAQRGALGAAGGAIKAFHGSPYDFEKFDVGKIGSGEGAQVYGHGLYFAEHPETAQSYKEQLTHRIPWPDEINALSDDARSTLMRATSANPDDPARAAKVAQWGSIELRGMDPAQVQKLAELAQSGRKGKMYEVNINADPEHFLDWNKVLGKEQREIAAKLVPDRAAYYRNPASSPNGQSLYDDLAGGKRANHEAATAKLREAGIPGIKYLDQGSRAGGEGTHNYVVFHHDIIDILKKYGLAGLVAAGAAHFKTRDDQ